MLAAHMKTMRLTWDLDMNGMMPKETGTVTPALSQRSRKRQQASLSKQSWVRRKLAPASCLARR